jgi:transposase-like protein
LGRTEQLDEQRNPPLRSFTECLAYLVDRGLSAESGLLIVIDGAKALAAGVKKVFGSGAVVQRCTLH